MKINSINATSNQKFGMAKFADPRVVEKLTRSVDKEDALALIRAIHQSGCKNTSVVDTYSGNRAMEFLEIVFPKSTIKCTIPVKYNDGTLDAAKLATDMAKGEKLLVEDVLYSAAKNGNLDKTKAELLEDLPELAEHIKKYSDAPELAIINENTIKLAKAKEAYQKAHPISTKLHNFLAKLF